jgi:hypothetical protein
MSLVWIDSYFYSQHWVKRLNCGSSSHPMII